MNIIQLLANCYINKISKTIRAPKYASGQLVILLASVDIPSSFSKCAWSNHTIYCHYMYMFLS